MSDNPITHSISTHSNNHTMTHSNRRRRKALHGDLLIPWRNGYYKAETFKCWLFYVKGTECTIEWVCGKPSSITSYFKGNLIDKLS